MKVFHDEFLNFLKHIFWCSWLGHKKSKWTEVWWAPGHSAGYKSKFCKVCHRELETTKKEIVT